MRTKPQFTRLGKFQFPAILPPAIPHRIPWKKETSNFFVDILEKLTFRGKKKKKGTFEERAKTGKPEDNPAVDKPPKPLERRLEKARNSSSRCRECP